MRKFHSCNSEQLFHSIIVQNINSLLYITQFNYIIYIYTLLDKLAIFDTVIVWESFIFYNFEQLSHNITVPNMNSLVNMDVVTVLI